MRKNGIIAGLFLSIDWAMLDFSPTGDLGTVITILPSVAGHVDKNGGGLQFSKSRLVAYAGRIGSQP